MCFVAVLLELRRCCFVPKHWRVVEGSWRCQNYSPALGVHTRARRASDSPPQTRRNTNDVAGRKSTLHRSPSVQRLWTIVTEKLTPSNFRFELSSEPIVFLLFKNFARTHATTIFDVPHQCLN